MWKVHLCFKWYDCLCQFSIFLLRFFLRKMIAIYYCSQVVEVVRLTFKIHINSEIRLQCYKRLAVKRGLQQKILWKATSGHIIYNMEEELMFGSCGNSWFLHLKWSIERTHPYAYTCTWGMCFAKRIFEVTNERLCFTWIHNKLSVVCIFRLYDLVRSFILYDAFVHKGKKGTAIFESESYRKKEDVYIRQQKKKRK